MLKALLTLANNNRCPTAATFCWETLHPGMDIMWHEPFAQITFADRAHPPVASTHPDDICAPSSTIHAAAKSAQEVEYESVSFR